MRSLKITLLLNLLLAALFTAATTGSLLARPNDWAAVPLACICFVWGMTWIITASWARDNAQKLIDERATLLIANELLEAEAFSANKELVRLHRERSARPVQEEPFWTLPRIEPAITPEAQLWAKWVRGRFEAENFVIVMRQANVSSQS